MTLARCLFDCAVDTPIGLFPEPFGKVKYDLGLVTSSAQPERQKKGFGNWLRRIPRILSLRMIPPGLTYCAQQSSYRVSAPKLTVKYVSRRQNGVQTNYTYWSGKEHPLQTVSSHMTFCRMLFFVTFPLLCDVHGF